MTALRAQSRQNPLKRLGAFSRGLAIGVSNTPGARGHANESLGNRSNNRGIRSLECYGPMRGIFSIVVLVALAVLLDSTLNDGLFTRAVTGMLSDISVHFN